VNVHKRSSLLKHWFFNSKRLKSTLLLWGVQESGLFCTLRGETIADPSGDISSI
jgi:hypothetical protein